MVVTGYDHSDTSNDGGCVLQYLYYTKIRHDIMTIVLHNMCSMS